MKLYKNQIAKRKEEFLFKQSKGIDYLVELELGNAPPMEYLLRNKPPKDMIDGADTSDTEEDDGDVEVAIDDLIEQLKVIKSTVFCVVVR